MSFGYSDHTDRKNFLLLLSFESLQFIDGSPMTRDRSYRSVTDWNVQLGSDRLKLWRKFGLLLPDALPKLRTRIRSGNLSPLRWPRTLLPCYNPRSHSFVTPGPYLPVQTLPVYPRSQHTLLEFRRPSLQNSQTPMEKWGHTFFLVVRTSDFLDNNDFLNSGSVRLRYFHVWNRTSTILTTNRISPTSSL